MASLSVGGTPMALSSAGEALPSVYTTRPGEAVPRWLCAELAQLDRASVYETEGRRFDSCIPRHPRFSHRFLSPSSVCGEKCTDLNSVLPSVRSSGRLSGKKHGKRPLDFFSDPVGAYCRRPADNGLLLSLPSLRKPRSRVMSLTSWPISRLEKRSSCVGAVATEP